MGDVQDRLEVKVVAARDLLEVEGGDCNPFGIVRCAGDVDQTMVANGTTEPEWSSSTMIFTDIAENDVDHVLVRVAHKNLSAQADVDLGQCIIDLRTAVLSPGIETDEWYDLQRTPSMDRAAAGRVRVEATSVRARPEKKGTPRGRRALPQVLHRRRRSASGRGRQRERRGRGAGAEHAGGDHLPRARPAARGQGRGR